MATTLRSSALLHSLCMLLFAIAAAPSPAATIRVPADQPTIQAGINAAATGDTVLVAPGTYYENIDFKGKAITVTSSGGATATIIDGGGIAGLAVVTFNSNETRTSVLSNFTVRNGGDSTFGSAEYGGVWVRAASPTILNNIIVNNACVNATIWGPTLFQGNTVGATNTTTYSNYCAFRGSGLYVGGSGSNDPHIQLDIIDNTIENNAGIINFGGNGNVFIGNTIRNNTGVEGAIAIYNTTNLIFINNLVYGNKAANVSQYPQGAGGMTVLVPSTCCVLYYGIIANNTFANNTASASEYAATQLFLDGDISSFTVSNNIFYGSGTLPALTCDGLYSYLSGPATFSHNDAFNPSGPAYDSSCGSAATNNSNVSKDPLFANAASDNFQLTSTSPLIDTGDNGVVGNLNQYMVSLTTDFAGNPRLQKATGTPCAIIDIGAYEYPGAPNTCTTSATLQSSLNPSTYGQNIVFTAQLSSPNGVPTGDVQFTDGSTILGTASVSSSGVATINTGLLAIGSHTITATYQPTGIFAATTATLIQVVNGYPTATAVTSSPNPAGYGQSITFTATVSSTTSGSGTPTGTISFTDGASLLATRPLTANGSSTASASFVTSALGAGVHTITATYVPTGAFTVSTATVTQTIIGLPTTTTLAPATPNPANALQPVTLSANVSTGTATIATGTVTFYNGAASLGSATLDATGHTTFTTTTLTPGNHTLRATYNGDTTFATSTSNPVIETVLLNPTSTTLTTFAPSPSYVTQPITVTAHVASSVSGTPTGIVYFHFGGVLQQATLNASGDATTVMLLPLSIGAAGTYPIYASYQGDTSFGGSASATAQQTILINPTSISLAVSPNPATQQQTVTLAATVQSFGSALISGTVNFYDGTSLLSSVNTDIRTPATITTNSLAVGTHTLTATFLPSPIFSGSTSSPITLTINPQDFTLTATPSITIQAEHHATTPIALASLGAFAGQINLSCSNLPQWTTCNFRPNDVPLVPNGTASTALYLDTDFVIGFAHNDTRSRPGWNPVAPITLALLLPTGLLLALRRRRLPVRLLLFALTTLAATLTLSGCSGLYPPHTAPGTYTITVTGTSGNITHSTNITLIVTP